MSHPIANLPAPPYYAVIFSSQRSADEGGGYARMAERMVELAQKQPGYLGVESVRGEDGFGITVSYWESEQAIANWRAHAEHRVAQRRGKEEWYEDFGLRVARVERAWTKGESRQEPTGNEGSSGYSGPYRVAAMEPGDIQEVLSFWNGMEGVGLNESDTPEAMEKYLARNPGLSLVARRDKALVAAVLCGHDGRRGYLHHLAVAAAHRRQKLGALMVQRCLDALNKLGCPKCNIFLFADNDTGTAFWLGQGWKKRADLLVVQKPT